MAKKVSKKTSTKSTKQTDYAVHYLSNNMKMPPKEISKELEISVSEVERILGESTLTNETVKTNSKSHDLMIRKTSAKGTNNVSIMTEAASQLNDEIKKHQHHPKKSFRDCIYRPRKNG